MEKTQEIIDLINWMGENIFPVKIELAVEKHNEGAILACIKQKLIQRSDSKVGAHPTMMRKVKGYMELTDAGWELFEKLKTKSDYDQQQKQKL